MRSMTLRMVEPAWRLRKTMVLPSDQRVLCRNRIARRSPNDILEILFLGWTITAISCGDGLLVGAASTRDAPPSTTAPSASAAAQPLSLHCLRIVPTPPSQYATASWAAKR